MENDSRPQFITFNTLYNELPEIDNEDPEFVLGLFTEARERCKKDNLPTNFPGILKGARRVMGGFSHEEKSAHMQLFISLSEPGLEVLRWFPQYADRLGIDVADPTKLLGYVTPDIILGFDMNLWTRSLEMIESMPEIAKNLKEQNDKPEMHLLDHGDKRGIVAIIGNGNSAFIIKEALGDNEEKISQKVAGIIGPRIISSAPGWIAEELLDSAHKLKDYVAHHPQTTGIALAIALKKIHELGISYNDTSLQEHVKISAQTGKVYLIDWSSAKEDGDISRDIKNAVSQIKSWYPEDSESKILALKAFTSKYRE